MSYELLRLSRHSISDADRQAVQDVMGSGGISRGSQVRNFERELAEYVGAEYCVVVSSGTAALHLACLASGIGLGSTVAVPAITFAATANAPMMCGAKVEVLDLGQTPATPHGMIQVLYAGAAKRPYWGNETSIIIEDACHALGARYEDGSMVGSCRNSLATCFSFHPTKVITTGEGGAITTNDEKLYHKMLRMRDNGRRDGVDMYEIECPGLNYWMSEMNAALGRSQLRRLAIFLNHRLRVAATYYDLLPEFAQAAVTYDANCAYHLFPVLIDWQLLGKSRQRVTEHLLKRGIETGRHYKPLSQFTAFEGQETPKADKFYEQELSIPIHCEMDENDAKRVCAALKELE